MLKICLLLKVRVLRLRPRKRNVREDQKKYKVLLLQRDCFTLEIQTRNEQKGFQLAEWLLRPGTPVFAGAFSSPPLYATKIQLNFIICTNEGN